MTRPSQQPVKTFHRLYCLLTLLFSSVVLFQGTHTIPSAFASSYPSSNLSSLVSNSGDNWAGYEALGRSGTFNKAQTYFTIPSLNPSTQGVTSEWAGIGGESAVTHSPVLVQAGVDSIMDSSRNQSNEAWIEVHDVYPSRYIHFLHGLHRGDGIYIYVESNVNHSGYDKFYIQNRTTHEELSFSLSGQQYISDGASGECILERLNEPLANFGKEKLSSCNLSDGKDPMHLSPIGSYPTATKVNMVSNHGSKHSVMFANP
ncbi:MAG TPA: G1 family glutamic endopeptidase, partial [Ktedonobacteraceae bacterium]|nr:G1 family glutamic endopeptidase [Ktedonobacteraceae bacterium]